MKRHSLRAWLRRDPAPGKVIAVLDDGTEQAIAIPADERTRWKTVEASIYATQAHVVKLLDRKGEVLRAQELENEEEAEEEDTPEEKTFKLQARSLKEYTGMLQAVMHEQNVSFSRGVDAASKSQEQLVNIVETLAEQFATALTNVHNIAANMANFQQQSAEREAGLRTRLAEAEGGEPNGEMKQLLAPLLQGMVAGAMAKKEPPPKTPKGGTS